MAYPIDGLTLRKATTQDSEFAYCVKKAAFKEYVSQVWGWDETQQRKLHGQRFAVQEFRVISVDGEDVGIVATAINSLSCPRTRGKGIGQECVLRIMDEARRIGLPVLLCVMKVNPRAKAFYLRLGFVQTGTTDTHDLMKWSLENRLGPSAHDSEER